MRVTEVRIDTSFVRKGNKNILRLRMYRNGRYLGYVKVVCCDDSDDCDLEYSSREFAILLNNVYRIDPIKLLDTYLRVARNCTW